MTDLDRTLSEEENMPDIADYIDATLLRPDATKEEIIRLCTQAKDHEFAAVCINPSRLELAAAELKWSPVALCTVIGFPLGAAPPQLKLTEMEWALNAGAREIDMVMNIGWFKDKEYIAVAEEIRLAARLVKEHGALLKVIVETALLDREELRRAAIVVREGGADFIKTSTGFASRGVSLEDLQVIQDAIGKDIKIKASGGIKTHDFAIKLIRAGADRLGSSSPIELLGVWDRTEED
ncbi:MAG: deoxyribose-phosphate aldolase [Solirubrobacterales bacterium]